MHSNHNVGTYFVLFQFFDTALYLRLSTIISFRKTVTSDSFSETKNMPMLLAVGYLPQHVHAYAYGLDVGDYDRALAVVLAQVAAAGM